MRREKEEEKEPLQVIGGPRDGEVWNWWWNEGYRTSVPYIEKEGDFGNLIYIAKSRSGAHVLEFEGYQTSKEFRQFCIESFTRVIREDYEKQQNEGQG